MRAWIDCEFNGFGGELISMAVVCENGAEWYNVARIDEPIDTWVNEHVMPLLGKEPLSRDYFNSSLQEFLKDQKPSIIIADWPSDLVHFFQSMLGSDHTKTLSMKIFAECNPSIESHPEIPHNALSDARALKRAMEE